MGGVLGLLVDVALHGSRLASALAAVVGAMDQVEVLVFALHFVQLLLVVVGVEELLALVAQVDDVVVGDVHEEGEHVDLGFVHGGHRGEQYGDGQDDYAGAGDKQDEDDQGFGVRAVYQLL